MIVCIDPGTTCIGIAVFDESQNELVSCDLIRGKDWIDTASKIPNFGKLETLVIEDPRIYPISKARPNDLMKLAKAVGAIVAKVDAKFTKLVTPSTWKGSVPKRIHQKRILRAMTDEEKNILNKCPCPKSLLHNTIDAVGIGLWYVRRM